MKQAAAPSLDQGRHSHPQRFDNVEGLELWFTQARAMNARVSGAGAIEKADNW